MDDRAATPAPLSDPFNLRRFLEAQDRADSYQRALGELRAGRKYSHWIWWIFPQLAGLGHSVISREYAITSLDEARAYLAHPVLGPRLRECTWAMNSHIGPSAVDILGHTDAMKFRSSMTLFSRADPSSAEFARALDQFFNGVADVQTDLMLGQGTQSEPD